MQTWGSSTVAHAGGASFVDAQRAYMTRVYLWMFIGLGATAATAFLTASTEAVFVPVMRYFWAFALAEFGLVMLLSFLAPRLSGAAAGALFLLYSALNGM